MTLQVSKSDVEATKDLARRSSFFERIEGVFSLRMDHDVRELLVGSLVDFVSALHEDAFASTRARSVDAVAKPLRAAVDALNRQKMLPDDAPDREGFRQFEDWRAEYQLSVFPDGTYEVGPTTGLLEADRTKPASKRRQSAKRMPIATCSIGLVDLERLAQAMSEPNVQGYSVKKSVRREFLLLDLAEVFHASGGRVAASYKPQSQKVDSPLIRFAFAVIDELPPSVRSYLKPDLPEAMRRLLRRIQWRKHGDGVPRHLFADTRVGRVRVSHFSGLHLLSQLRELGIDAEQSVRSARMAARRKSHKPKKREGENEH